MKRSLLLLITLSVLCLGGYRSVKAQPNTPIAPQFVKTDMENVEHDLHAYLDAGYTVILDIWATWCGPCISSMPHLETIWDDHGPNGDNTIRLLSIEVDAQTSNEQSLINQHGIPNPVFDNGHTFAYSLGYSTGYLPTFFIICPDRSYQYFSGGINNPAALTNLVDNCAGLSTTQNDVRYLPYGDSESTFDVFCDGSYTPASIWIQNLGSADLTEMQVVTKVDGNVVNTDPWSGNLSQYEGELVSVSDLTGLSAGNHTVTFELSNPNGTTDDQMSNNVRTLSLSDITTESASTEITVTLETDNFGSETAWEVRRLSNNTVVASGDEYPNVSGGATYTESFTAIPGECYSFKITDSYGDGICCGQFGDGSYTLTTAGGQTLMTGGNFDDEEVDGFKVKTDATAINENDFAAGLNIYPNPLSNQATVNYGLIEPSRVTISLTNVLGELVYNNDMGTQLAGQHTFTLDASDINAGIYFVNFNVGETTVTKRVSITK